MRDAVAFAPKLRTLFAAVAAKTRRPERPGKSTDRDAPAAPLPTGTAQADQDEVGISSAFLPPPLVPRPIPKPRPRGSLRARFRSRFFARIFRPR